jgi:hypothetical protein
MEGERDGVKWSRAEGSPRLRLAVAVLAVMLFAVAGWLYLRPAHPQESLAEDEQRAPVGAPQAFEPRPPAPREARPSQHQPSQQQPSPPRPAPPTMRADAADTSTAEETDPDAGWQDVYLEQLPRGDGGGIDAFPRPGTKPILRGLIVPESFELPQGYVRHVQVTDDGRELPPILMFHPDYHPPGVTIPDNRVVPEDLAPPGMPHEWLTPPPLRP